MIGLGYYGTLTPAVIRRNVLENPAWYTAYTPYQPEISQGRLEALLNFQTMVADLTGLAIGERVAARRGHRRRRGDGAGAARRPRRGQRVRRRRRHPAADHRGARDPGRAARHRGRGRRPATRRAAAGADFFGLLLQYPGASGAVRDHAALVEAAHAAGALVAVAADLLALTLLRPPGEIGADIAVGSTQRFGVPMGFGGPHAGYMAVRGRLERQLPGRLVGVSRDADGDPAYRLALQTREQHIRREKATSNICTAQVLLAVMAGMYAVYHGPDGLRGDRHGGCTAGRRRWPPDCAADGVEVVHGAFFDTVLARVPGRAADGRRRPPRRGVNLRLVDADHVGIACDETTTAKHLAAGLGGLRRPPRRCRPRTRGVPTRCPATMRADIATT